jgi:hypothetical protein
MGLFEVGPNEELLITTLCIRTIGTLEGSTGLPCTVLVPATRTGHNWEFRATSAPCLEGHGLEVNGHWLTEGEGFEAIHL